MDVKTVPMTAAAEEPQAWNTKNLGLRLATDAVSGFSAASMVAPLIAVIDKYAPSPASQP